MTHQTLNDYLSFAIRPLQLRAFDHIMSGMTTKLVIYGVIDLRISFSVMVPPNHEHINNNNGLKDHHFRAKHPRNINKHIGLIGWPFCSFYKSYN